MEIKNPQGQQHQEQKKTIRFLTAAWRKLAMANYCIPPEMLRDFVPFGTEIDRWKGNCYISLVGFMFEDTRLMGIPIPFHRNFEEVNLRFYVRARSTNGWRRGVVFIKEIVPKPMLSLVANLVYSEHYITLPMKHRLREDDQSIEVEYAWQKSDWNSIRIQAENKPIQIAPGSEEAFITEHYWGYTQISANETLEYQVEHPRWQVYPVGNFSINVNFGEVYGAPFVLLNALKPSSVFLAEGSEIIVRRGRRSRFVYRDRKTSNLDNINKQ